MKLTEDQAYLSQYDTKQFDIPIYSVDVAIYTLHENQLNILLVQRAQAPEVGKWSLPGGFVDLKEDSTIEITAKRKLLSKTGVNAPHLEQVSTIGNASRDPRGWSVTTLYMALIPYAPTESFVEAVADAQWWPINDISGLDLAFDHHDLINTARERLKNKTAYTVLPIHIIRAPFSLTQLQQAFEILMDKKLEKKSFRRRMANAELLKEVGEGKPEGGKGRPAALYIPAPGSEEHLFTRAFND
ncbi:NrtR DNA-binding winged helix domain-containing protein [Neptuniibacter sp. QD48_55]|uniref:NrtR DNA-binding winged helix domain-containing protein n=1 Tax=Neptuniibacter sp. QD48_55 TaxID=3398212 RepID=UPI0039F623AB